MKEPFFQPWVGENYNAQTPKILVLGESHYARPDEYKADFTQNVIKGCALTSGKGSRPFFTKIAKVLLGKPYEWISSDEKSTLWNQVAFYNYIQEFVGGAARVRPTPEMWNNAAESLNSVLEQLTPDIVIVTGKELAHHIEPVTEKYTGPAKFCYWTHPSARAFKKEDAVTAFDDAKKQYAS